MTIGPRSGSLPEIQRYLAAAKLTLEVKGRVLADLQEVGGIILKQGIHHRTSRILAPSAGAPVESSNAPNSYILLHIPEFPKSRLWRLRNAIGYFGFLRGTRAMLHFNSSGQLINFDARQLHVRSN